MPVVSVDYALIGEKKFDFVGTVDAHGGQLAAEHLLEQGHKRIAGVFADVESIQLRRRGFEGAVSRQKDAGEPQIIEGWDFNEEKGNTELGKSVLESDGRPSAIFASGDFMLPIICRVANELGLSIPGDLSVVGFGDMEFTQYLQPSATTLHQDAYEIGVQAAQLVIDRIENKDRKTPVRQLRFEPHLVVRESTAPPKG